MKIENFRAAFESIAARRTERPDEAGSGDRSRAVGADSAGDRLEVSPEAAKMAAAVRAAQQAPAVREDVVARVREKLEAGELADSTTVAERMLDDLLGGR